MKGLPEEVVDHVDHFAAVNINQQHVVIVTHPAIGPVNRRQTVLVRIVDPIILTIESAVEEKSDAQPAVAIVAVRRVIAPGTIEIAVLGAIAGPIVARVAAPVVVIPPAMIAAAAGVATSVGVVLVAAVAIVVGGAPVAISWYSRSAVAITASVAPGIGGAIMTAVSAVAAATVGIGVCAVALARPFAVLTIVMMAA